MRNACRFLFVIGLMSFTAAYAMGQEDDFISRLKTQLLLYRTQRGDQQIVVQTDKMLYRQGETIWMKGYVTDAITHSLSLNSRELSVQLTDNKGINVLEGKFLLQNGIADFNFPVPADLPSDSYYLVAYTPEMENSGIQDVFKKELVVGRPEYPDIIPHVEYSKPFFSPECKESFTIRLNNYDGKPVSGKRFEYQMLSEEKELLSGKGKTGTNGAGEAVFFTPAARDGHAMLALITIPSGKDRVNLVSKIPLSSEKIIISFFPEGGKIVPGIPQLVVFEAKDQIGDPVSIISDILDEQDNLIVSAATSRPGLGAFTLLNSGNRKLKLRIVSDIGKNQETWLPPFSSDGMSIAVKKGDGINLPLLVARSPKSEPANFKAVAVSKGELIWACDFALEQSGVINLPLEKLKSEISAIAIFDQKGTLVAQRLIYTKQNKSYNITFSPNKSVYKKGEEGLITVKIADSKGNPAKAELTVSIADKYAFPASATRVGSLDYGLEKPFPLDEPFEKISDTTVNYSLLSNSLRGFDWGNILSIDVAKGSTTKVNAIRISGTVLDDKNSPVPYALVSLTSTSLQQFNAGTDQNGEFVINLPVSVEKRNLTASATDGAGKGSYHVLLNKSFKDELVNSLNHIQVNNWQMSEQMFQSGYFRENPNFFRFKPSVKVRGDEKKVAEPYWKKYLTGSSSLLEIIKTIRPFEMSGGKIIFRGVNSFIAQDGALIVMDGQRMGTDASILSSVNPADVEDIRILLDPVEMGAYTALNSVGVIEIKTKRGGSEDSNSIASGDLPKDHTPKQFIPEAIGDAKYDLKTTLQWIPVLLTNEQGEATIPFRAGGIKSTFVVEVAGFTNQQQWIGAKTEVEVE